MNELTYFIIASVVALAFIYFMIKLLDKAKLRRLRKKFPEGTETIAKPVGRLDEVPISVEAVVQSEEHKKEIVEKLLE